MSPDSPASLSAKPKRVAPIWWWALVAAGILASVIVGQVDQAFSYIFAFLTLLVGCLIVLIRHLWLGKGRFMIRALPLVGFVGLLGTALAVLRIDDLTGNLVPTKVSFRWQPQRDELLSRPLETRDAAGIDLRTTTDHDFPQFLGPAGRAAIDNVSLAPDWNAQPPRRVWHKDQFGAGWSAFSAVNGYAVTQEQRGPHEIVTCYQISTGELVWSNAIQARHHTVPGGVGPRSTPTISDGKIYVQGATGMLRCLDGSSGDELWRHDLLSEIGMTPAQDLELVAWGRAASPLVDNGRVIVPLGGPQGPTVGALDASSGAWLWKQGSHQVSYASPIVAELDGVRQLVLVCENFVCGHDAETGEPLWEFQWPGESNSNASCTQPIPAGDNRLFLSKGYAHGAALIRITQQATGGWNVAPLWHRRTVMKTKFSNPLIYRGHVYGLDDSILSCVELETGRRKWKRGRYGHGQILRVGEMLLVQAESGDVLLVSLTPQRHEELGRFSAIAGKTWNNPCLYGKFLLVRNAEQAACFELP